MDRSFGARFDLLLGRKTCEIFAAHQGFEFAVRPSAPARPQQFCAAIT